MYYKSIIATDTAFSIRLCATAIFATVCNAIPHIAPLAILCFCFVLLDCITAWRLAARLSVKGKSSGKFRSDKFKNAVIEMVITVPIALLLAYFVQLYIFEGSNIHLPQIVSGIIIFRRFWSMLENISSGDRDEVWAKTLQKIMIDKAERHLDVNLSELKNNINSSNHEKEDNQKDSQSQDCKQG